MYESAATIKLLVGDDECLADYRERLELVF